MKVVRDFIRDKRHPGAVVALVGICSDKEVEKVLRILDTAVTQFVFTQVANPRAMDAHILAETYTGSREKLVVVNPDDALIKAVFLAGKDGLVLVTGSLYLVGEVLKKFGYSLDTL
jgi:dihydrofolate synthase/folylpolyglutamate synthase